MKTCPRCRHPYYDETLNFCLDDGAVLVPDKQSDGPATAILPDPETLTKNRRPTLDPSISSRIQTEPTLQRPEPARNVRGGIWVIAVCVALLISALVFAYSRIGTNDAPLTEAVTSTPRTQGPDIYWQLDESGQTAFIRDRARYIQSLIGDEPTDFDDEAIQTIKIEIDYYVGRKDSLSQKQFEEGLKVIYGRATQYAPLVIRAYEDRRVPPALGLYQAMIESEYRDCPTSPFPNGPVGMFQFSRRTGARYGLVPSNYCDVSKQADAAARYMSDLSSDFGEGKSNATLGLFSYTVGETAVRDYLRQLRGRGVTERSFWAILKNRQTFGEDIPPLLPPSVPLIERGLNYVPRFFAAAIIGETPAAFGLPTPPLSGLRDSG